MVQERSSRSDGLMCFHFRTNGLLLLLINRFQILDTLRSSTNGNANTTSTSNSAIKAPLKPTHLNDLDDIAARHFRSTQAPVLAITGRQLPLILKLASTLASPPHNYALLIIDLDNRFDATRLSCSSSDARHIYVHRPPQLSTYESSPTSETPQETTVDHLRALVAEAGNFMLYTPSAAHSSSRRWWGTIVLGGLGAGDIVAGWKGWLRVNRENVSNFNLGVSAEEALVDRDARQRLVDGAGWTAESQWGGFNFSEGV